jgi:hypothetical protein
VRSVRQPFPFSAFPPSRLPVSLLLLALLAGTTACGDECEDADGDGFGDGCERGADCDDTLASRNTDCTAPAPDCEADPYAVGCTCYVGQKRECFPGDETMLGVGLCRAGEQRCGRDGWLECRDAVLPDFERCNAIDDDCDGHADEGVRSPCGGCNDTCRGGVWGEGEAPFSANDELDIDAYGALVLRSHPLATATVFVPNTGEGTLSAIDPDSALERARYRTLAARPAQIAIDYDGHAWVLGQAADGGAALSQVAANEASCIDRDGDGLETSHGPEELLPLDGDECVLLNVALDPELGPARALAVAGLRAPDQMSAVVWVGLPEQQALLALDGASGEELRRIATDGFEPYAMTFDPWGTLWVIDRDGLLAVVETTLTPPTVDVLEAQLRCYVLESIASDEAGVITLAGAECESVTRYDPVRDTWSFVDMPGVLDARGIASLVDDSWVTHTAGRLTRISHAPLALDGTYSLGSAGLAPYDSSAISGDDTGRLWIASGSGGPGGLGLLTRFDVAGGRVTAQTPLGFLPRPEGDLTGARRFSELEPEGAASHVFTGCTRSESSGSTTGTTWRALHIAGVVGMGSAVEAEARHAETREALDDAAYVSLGVLPDDPSPFPLDLPEGGVLEIRLTLRSTNHHGGPRIARAGLEWSCPGPQ